MYYIKIFLCTFYISHKLGNNRRFKLILGIFLNIWIFIVFELRWIAFHILFILLTVLVDSIVGVDEIWRSNFGTCFISFCAIYLLFLKYFLYYLYFPWIEICYLQYWQILRAIYTDNWKAVKWLKGGKIFKLWMKHTV